MIALAISLSIVLVSDLERDDEPSSSSTTASNPGEVKILSSKVAVELEGEKCKLEQQNSAH